MKRFITLILFLVIFLGTESVLSQARISFEVSYRTDTKPNTYGNKDIREFHAFQKDVSDFDKAVYREKIRKAQRVKNDILRRMKKEISDTQEKIRFLKYENKQFYNQGLRKKGEHTNKYSKRNSGSSLYRSGNLEQLNDQLRIQKRIYFKLVNMDLNRGRYFFEQARRHQRLMEDFEETLRFDIDNSFKDYRTRNRRGK
ncbi:MAG TPA: hypothetical protein DCL80_12515 [Balneola sp.]|jgi:hypothetical protein|nr:hypothetical protein [Balneola sp.]MAO76592.1 hypothetical protein [Balneola sp.]MBF63738.1 hypothetical protein [Balneola sp.]HAH52020.1 hypothetical protein [Balneola sp.]HAW78270.1 hypothetical protein [Balneola sp.]